MSFLSLYCFSFQLWLKMLFYGAFPHIHATHIFRKIDALISFNTLNSKIMWILLILQVSKLIIWKCLEGRSCSERWVVRKLLQQHLWGIQLARGGSWEVKSQEDHPASPVVWLEGRRVAVPIQTIAFSSRDALLRMLHPLCLPSPRWGVEWGSGLSLCSRELLT